jgi:exosome complex RNA-binding protein Csl4
MLSELSIKRAVNKAKRTNSIVTIRRDELGVIYVVYPNGRIDMNR